jgi:chromosome transmission fidelity protein 1
MSDYQQHLFSYVLPSRIMTLSCSHVIPASNLLAYPVAKGPNGMEFDFTFEKRNTEGMIAELGEALILFASSILDGLVIFFPSYSYLDICISTWKRKRRPKTAESIWDTFGKIKRVFLESRSTHASHKETSNLSSTEQKTESVLQSYSSAILSSSPSRGALLLAVVGGSLSEGINFSDRLGRGVVVIGLPFPNPHSAEWKAKMAFVSGKTAALGKDGKAAAREFYENACMRAVNQSVGRAIRHQGDYATILMLDRRYGTERIRGKLPGWIQRSLKVEASVDKVVQDIRAFFKSKASV